MTDTQTDWTPDALTVWQSLTPENRDIIIRNVYCSHCGGTATITDFTGWLHVSGDLILNGQCAKCGGKVARHIETGDPYRLIDGVMRRVDAG